MRLLYVTLLLLRRGSKLWGADRGALDQPYQMRLMAGPGITAPQHTHSPSAHAPDATRGSSCFAAHFGLTAARYRDIFRRLLGLSTPTDEPMHTAALHTTQISPTHTVLTRILCSASSFESALVSAMPAARVTEVGTERARGVFAPT